MKLKYFQEIADIKKHYEEILLHFEHIKKDDGSALSKFAPVLLNTWGISMSDYTDILEENEALKYLISLYYGYSGSENRQKPSLHIIVRCFNREIEFLKKIYKIDDHNANKHRSPLITKRYMACRHYLFEFSFPRFHQNLPDIILTLENAHQNT